MKTAVSAIIKRQTDLPFGFCKWDILADRLLDCRAKSRIPENAKTAIVFLFPYKVRQEKPKNISRYAAVPDYHSVCGKILEEIKSALFSEFPENRFEAFIDNSPVPEVLAASAAGLGKIGKNGLLISERFGSYVFIGEIVTDLQVSAECEPTRCADCGACAAVCPVGLKKEECLSAATQQKKPLSPELEELIIKSGCVWGCDICQDVCPLNKKAEFSSIPEFLDGYRDEYIIGENIEGRAYAWRGEGVISRNARLF